MSETRDFDGSAEDDRVVAELRRGIAAYLAGRQTVIVRQALGYGGAAQVECLADSARAIVAALRLAGAASRGGGSSR